MKRCMVFFLYFMQWSWKMRRQLRRRWTWQHGSRQSFHEWVAAEESKARRRNPTTTLSHSIQQDTQGSYSNSCLTDKRPPPEVHGQSAGSIDSSIELVCRFRSLATGNCGEANLAWQLPCSVPCAAELPFLFFIFKSKRGLLDRGQLSS